jgi:hypothetical protein
MKDRSVIELPGLSAEHLVTVPARYILKSPRHGGPPLSEVRAFFVPRGQVRFSGTAARLFVDLDPGDPEPALIALDMIARSDADGLERAILSALPHVDEIVIGVDGRSDETTHAVARAFADTYHVFQAKDIELSDADWAADKIHFSNARNLGRARVKAPWALVLDTDEYFSRFEGDMRAAVRDAGATVGSFTVEVLAEDARHDSQRLARTEARWWSASHNQLVAPGVEQRFPALVAHDTSLRPGAEVARRDEQRRSGIDDLEAEAKAGQLPALFHLAKHRLSQGGDLMKEGVKLAEDYRLRTPVHGPFFTERRILGLAAASAYYQQEDFTNAELWLLRTLLDGPLCEALCLLGDIAEDRGNLQHALAWYEAACAMPDLDKACWPAMVEMRWGRREGLRRTLAAEPVLDPTVVTAAAATPGT